jgi:hypothetical protein
VKLADWAVQRVWAHPPHVREADLPAADCRRDVLLDDGQLGVGVAQQLQVRIQQPVILVCRVLLCQTATKGSYTVLDRSIHPLCPLSVMA